MLNPIVTDLKNLASQTASENGFDLCGVEVLSQPIPMTLQVQIRHKDGGDVSLDDCACFSEPMGEAIETSKLFNDAYVLEISSPGLSDQLTTDRDFKTFKSFPVEVIFRSGQDEVCQKGLLHSRSKDNVQLNTKGRMNRIPRKSVIAVRLTSSTG